MSLYLASIFGDAKINSITSIYNYTDLYPLLEQLGTTKQVLHVEQDQDETKHLRLKYRNNSNAVFITLDPIEEVLPKANLIIIGRSIHEHSFESISKIFKNIKSANADFLFIDSLMACDPNGAKFQNHRIVNFENEPYFLPKPFCIIPVGNRFFHLWSIRDIGFFLDTFSPEYAELRSEYYFKIDNILQSLRTILASDQIFRTFLQKHQENWTDSTEFCYTIPVKKLLEKNNNEGFELRTTIFRLAFACELDQINIEFPSINNNNLKHAQLLCRNIISNYLSDNP